MNISNNLLKLGLSPYTVINSNIPKYKELYSQYGAIIEGCKGRKENLLSDGYTSVFDPVLCEILYTFFCEENFRILDLFCGGITRAFIANMLNLVYLGIDIRKEQIDSNKEILNKNNIKFLNGDSDIILDRIKDNEFDFILSCPPYHDLEVYSDLDNDLSNMDYNLFLEKYKSIISKSIAKLKNNRFVCIVISNIRDSKGFYKPLVFETIKIFIDNNMCFYNDIAFISRYTNVKNTNKSWINRKMIKIHENILVFYKGDLNEIPNIFSKQILFQNPIL